MNKQIDINVVRKRDKCLLCKLKFREMKKILTVLFLASAMPLFAQTEIPNLRFDSDKYFYSRAPGNNQRIRFDINIVLPIVQVFTTDNQNANNRIRSSQNGVTESGKPFMAIVSPLLYDATTQGSTKIFKYGQNGGESDFDHAEVRVMRVGAAATPSRTGTLINPPFKFRMNSNDIFSENSTGGTEGRTIIKVEASASQTATIEISRQSERGNVFVCIFDSKGKLLASLDPKSSENDFLVQSYTVDNTVYILPVVGPKVTTLEGVQRVLYEVGDPKEVAFIETEEE